MCIHQISLLVVLGLKYLFLLILTLLHEIIRVCMCNDLNVRYHIKSCLLVDALSIREMLFFF